MLLHPQANGPWLLNPKPKVYDGVPLALELPGAQFVSFLVVGHRHRLELLDDLFAVDDEVAGFEVVVAEGFEGVELRGGRHGVVAAELETAQWVTQQEVLDAVGSEVVQ